MKTLVTFLLRRVFVSALSKGMVSSIKSAAFPLMIIQHISSSGAFLLMLEKIISPTTATGYPGIKRKRTTEAQLAAEHQPLLM